MFQPRTAILVTCAVLTILLAAPASAQPAPGKITGTLRDLAGAPVGGATITITNQDTGQFAPSGPPRTAPMRRPIFRRASIPSRAMCRATEG